MPLTDTACKNARCAEGRPRERYSDSGGLYLEVQPTGAKHWRWKYRFAGKEKRLALGSYPDVSLANARRGRDAARETLKGGADPVQAKKSEKIAKQFALDNNFKTVALAWYEHWRFHGKTGPKSSRHADYVKARLEADVFPVLGARPIGEITAREIVNMAKKIQTRGAYDIAHRAWQACGQIFAYGIGAGVCERNPCKELPPGSVLKSRQQTHFARVDEKDLPDLLRRMEAYAGSPFTRFALKIMTLTFVRTGELIGAHWDEFDLDAAEWRIPASRMKMRTLHIVPLSEQAVETLRCLLELRGLSGLLFPGERDHDKPMSNGTILGALRRMGYAGRMTGHGFRGLASTSLHEMGFDHAHIELQLAHMERDQVSAAYNFATYLPARRKMMQAWADHLDALRQGAKVIPFKAA